MINYILQPVLELKAFIITAAVAAVMLTGALLLVLERRKSGLGSFGLQALFLNRKPLELCFLSLGFLELVYVAAMIAYPVSMGREELVLLAALCVLRAAAGLSVSEIAAEAAYGVLTAAALTAGSLLHDYMADTGTDWYVMTVRILLLVFLVQYSLYHLIKGVERMLRRNERAREKRARKGTA